MRAAAPRSRPSCPPSAATAALCSGGEIVVRTGCRRRRGGDGEHALPGQQLAARSSPQAIVEGALEAAEPDEAVARHALCAAAPRGARRGSRRRSPTTGAGGFAERASCVSLRRPAGSPPCPRAFREDAAVAGEQRRARRQRGAAAERARRAAGPGRPASATTPRARLRRVDDHQDRERAARARRTAAWNAHRHGDGRRRPIRARADHARAAWRSRWPAPAGTAAANCAGVSDRCVAGSTSRVHRRVVARRSRPRRSARRATPPRRRPRGRRRPRRRRRPRPRSRPPAARGARALCRPAA